MFKSWAKKVLPLCLVLMITGCGALHASKEETDRDLLISRHIRHALFKNDVVPKSGRHFDVTTRKGIVTLTGVADDISQMQNAVTIAKHAQGVVEVENKIQVTENLPSQSTMPVEKR